MEVKANIQKRRQDRLRQLEARPSTGERGLLGLEAPIYGSPPPGESLYPPEYSRSEQDQPESKESSLYTPGPLDGQRWEDPETAWRNRERELLDWYRDKGNPDRYSLPKGGRPLDPGLPPTGPGGPPKGSYVPSRRLIGIKLVLAAGIFGTVWYMHLSDKPWAQEGRAYVVRSLTVDMDFTYAAAWYDRMFSGTPSFLPAFGSNKKPDAAKVNAKVARFIAPVKGTVITGFSVQKQGVTVETERNAKVAAMDEGRIVFTGEREGTGHTLTVQHAGGYRSTYGLLQGTKWEVGDWVKAGDIIGTVQENAGSSKDKLFFSVMKDQQYVNPAGVVSFD